MTNFIGTLLARHAMKLRGVVAALLSTGGAAYPTGAGSAPGPEAAALARIDGLIGAASCTCDGQCQVAHIGYRSCGGPESFRAWSTLDTNPALLEAALREHAQERRRQQEKSGEMSTCNVLPVPAAFCMPPQTGTGAGRCALSATPGIR